MGNLICRECGSLESEVAFIDKNTSKCSCCLNEDPNYWRKRCYALEKIIKEVIDLTGPDDGYYAIKQSFKEYIENYESK